MFNNSSVVVEDVEANSDQDVKVRRFENKEVLVLVLEHKLVDKWILLQSFECL